MFSQYFEEWKVREEFKKEFICIFDGWLGKDNLNKLDEVTEQEWSKFNNLLRLVAREYKLQLVNIENKSLSEIENIERMLATYEVSMNKDSDKFSKYVIPELGCVITEEWDYTYILWHTNNGAVAKLAPLIKEVELYNFHD
jgi:hypothetical protein